VGDVFPCPCRGHLTFDENPGSYAICPVCFWEDDMVQLRWPDWSGGANKASLIAAQVNFTRIGASEPRLAVTFAPGYPASRSTSVGGPSIRRWTGSSPPESTSSA
jgi:hypothetical protein